jgi:glycosyltransferase involved in cell wall biosynthesis
MVYYVHQYFNTPQSGGPLRSYYLAGKLASDGFEVELITAGKHTGKLEWAINGFKVTSLPVSYNQNMSYWRRKLSFIGFSFLVIRHLRSRLKKDDLLYLTSTPLTIGTIGLWAKWSVNTRFIFEVRDLWPEAPYRIGAIGRLTYWLMKILEKKCYLSAEAIVALSPPIQEHIKLRTSKPVFLIPNFSNSSDFRLPTLRKTDDSFQIMYAGAIGYVNNLNFILKCARSCKNSELDVNFKIIGTGSKLNKVYKNAVEQSLDNIQFIPHLSTDHLIPHIESCSAIFVSYLNVPALFAGSPNKFFEGLAAGKLIIINFKGWIYELIMDHQCGIYLDPDQPEKIISKLEPFYNEPQLLLNYQQNARDLSQQFDRDIMSMKFSQLLADQMN